MNSPLFYVREDVRVWAHWNHSFDMHLNDLGLVNCFSPSWTPSGCTVGGGYCGWRLDSCKILMFTYMAGDVHSLFSITISSWMSNWQLCVSEAIIPISPVNPTFPLNCSRHLFWLQNPVHFTYRIYLESEHFSPSSSLPYNKPPLLWPELLQ